MNNKKIKLKIFLESICALIFFINTIYIFLAVRINFAVDITLVITSLKLFFESLEEISFLLWKLKDGEENEQI
ncbi:hypothetical protein [Clostridium senegalense]